MVNLTVKVIDLTWLNPAPAYPYGWAEGPVMWKTQWLLLL